QLLANSATPLEFIFNNWRMVLMVLAIVCPTTVFVTPIFILCVKYASTDNAFLGKTTGRLYFINSCGAFAGAMAVQFGGFALFGTKNILFIIAVILSFTLIFVMKQGKILSVLAGITAVLLLLALPKDWWFTLQSGYMPTRGTAVEGVTGISSIQWDDDNTGHIRVNGQYMSALPDHPLHEMYESFVLASPTKRNILLLGLGSGAMVREFIKDPQVERIEIVEWSHELFRLLQTPKAKILLKNCLKDQRVRLRICDARLATRLYRPGSFDVIVDTLTYYKWVGSTSLRSVQYMSQLAPLLTPQGIYLLQVKFDWDVARKMILGSLFRYFSTIHEYREHLVCANHPIFLSISNIPEQHIKQRAKFKEEAPTVKYPSPEVFRQGPFIRDEFPYLEYQKIH
ncbi:MAG: hypothetical protein KKH68_00485, partial [Proteobacteria bacterium]|nr:hypothetical protein [Pseudomonadota bacterium]